MSCDFIPEADTIHLIVPAIAHPGEEVVVSGWGADPGDLIMMSLRYSMTITPKFLDLGDAPASYATFLKDNGAGHAIAQGIYLGKSIDGELDGQPSPSSSCDDADGNNDDDGVIFATPLEPGKEANIIVMASAAGYLNAWIDFNGNGNWTDQGEQIFQNAPLAAGNNSLQLSIPSGSHDIATYARFRFSTRPDLSYTGIASDGEVEDYLIAIGRANTYSLSGQKNHCASCSLLPLLGTRLCFISQDYMSMQTRPLGCGLISWQYSSEMEEKGRSCHQLEHSVNPFYFPKNVTNGEFFQAKPPSQGILYCDCMTMVLAGKPLGPTVKIINTGKRTVQADKNGNFSTSILIPDSKSVGGTNIFTATGTNKSGVANVTIDASGIANEAPYSLIYAPELEDKNWKVTAGDRFILDGQTLSVDNDGHIVSYHWDLGDRRTSTEAVITHAYSQPGEKKVSLTVQDDKGASDTSSIMISVA